MEGSLEGSHGDRVRLEDGRGHRGGLHHYPGLNWALRQVDQRLRHLHASSPAGSRAIRAPATGEHPRSTEGRREPERSRARASRPGAGSQGPGGNQAARGPGGGESAATARPQIHGNLEVGLPDPGQRAAPDPRPRDPLWAWIRGGSVRGMSSSGEAMCMGYTGAGSAPETAPQECRSCREAAKAAHDTRGTAARMGDRLGQAA